jgi:hypothetical protein
VAAYFNKINIIIIIIIIIIIKKISSLSLCGGGPQVMGKKHSQNYQILSVFLLSVV